jgi:uncharacterized membrane protein
MNTRELSLATVFAALYGTAVIFLAPVSFGPVQLRIADVLIPLAALFGWPAIVGVSLGCLISNSYYWLGMLDVLLGSAANLLAATSIFLLRKRPLLGCIVGSLIIGLIVGGYLWLFFPPPDLFAAAPAWFSMVVSITLSSLIAVSVMGYSVLRILSRPIILRILVSKGLRVYMPKK